MTIQLLDIRRLIVAIIFGMVVTFGAMAQADAALSHFWKRTSEFSLLNRSLSGMTLPLSS